MAKLLGKLIGLLGGLKAIKKVLIDLLVKVLVKATDPVALATDVHNGVQDKGRDLLGLKGYESLEKQMLEPFAAELLRLWKKD